MTDRIRNGADVGAPGMGGLSGVVPVQHGAAGNEPRMTNTVGDDILVTHEPPAGLRLTERETGTTFAEVPGLVGAPAHQPGPNANAGLQKDFLQSRYAEIAATLRQPIDTSAEVSQLAQGWEVRASPRAIPLYPSDVSEYADWAVTLLEPADLPVLDRALEAFFPDAPPRFISDLRLAIRSRQ